MFFVVFVNDVEVMKEIGGMNVVVCSGWGEGGILVGEFGFWVNV